MLDVREGLCPARLRGVSCSLYPLRLLKTPIGLTSRFLSSAFDIIFCRSIFSINGLVASSLATGSRAASREALSASSLSDSNS